MTFACRSSGDKEITISMSEAPGIDNLQAVDHCFSREKPHVGLAHDFIPPKQSTLRTRKSSRTVYICVGSYSCLFTCNPFAPAIASSLA